MMQDSRLPGWAAVCAYGAREFLLAMDLASRKPEIIAYPPVILPSVDIGPLADPLREAGFMVPDGEPERRRVPAARPPSRAAATAAVLGGEEVRWAGFPADAPSPGLPPPLPAPDAFSSNSLSMLSVILQKFCGDGDFVTNLDFSAISDGARKSDALVGRSAGVRATLPDTQVPRETVSSKYAALYRRAERLLSKWTSDPLDWSSAAGSGNGANQPDAVEFVRRTVAGAVQVRNRGVVPESQAAVRGSAPFPVKDTPAEQTEQRLTYAVDRMVETLRTVEEKFETRRKADDLPAANGAIEGEIRWLEDDDLAERLQSILKRQARRRGIDVS